MAKPNSLQEFLADWENLLAEVRRTPYDIPLLAAFLIALEGALGKARAAKARQIACSNGRQQATRQLNEAVAEGREVASRMRLLLKGRLGYHNEDLVRFGATPVRKRRPRPAPQPPQSDSQAG